MRVGGRFREKSARLSGPGGDMILTLMGIGRGHAAISAIIRGIVAKLEEWGAGIPAAILNGNAVAAGNEWTDPF
jgi:hypothetical protein